jgi:hypothetical protein
MKIKTRKSIKKRYNASNPLHNRKPKITHKAQGYSHNAGKKRKFRQFRGKIDKSLKNPRQIDKVIQAIS